MEDFVDTYMNLTLKTIMGMKWMSTFCAQAKFMMKTDDDMYVSYGNIIKYLDQSQKANFMTGYVMHGGPIRNPKSKWYMPKKSYPGSKYPPFCSGTGYILSGDVPPKVYFTSLSTPYLYLEDVYVAVMGFGLNCILSPRTIRNFIIGGLHTPCAIIEESLQHMG
ncbi:Beta-1,3-galactosyltransferase 1 [Holothuria leucospilota]|uniref:Hexosyltransferase n=1 Tax=Holothuria leucospilota TaxID=206669 RepID=A0A9Q1BXF3_HOLLE|nr:Beta-1,3-galactosyltransferase 1 [Holothuria leucospilota]